jgi:hypothetical protein
MPFTANAAEEVKNLRRRKKLQWIPERDIGPVGHMLTPILHSAKEWPHHVRKNQGSEDTREEKAKNNIVRPFNRPCESLKITFSKTS